MAAEAVRLAGSDSGEPVPSQDVLPAGHRLQMVRVDTRRYPAEVVGLEPGLNEADE
jgi:hypothetical protein